MTQGNIRRIAVAMTLTAALAAPGQAATGRTISAIPGAGWIEAALQWMAGVWPGRVMEAPAASSGSEKSVGTDPSVATVAPPPPSTSGDKGYGIDPNG
jgi:hypothetical protein